MITLATLPTATAQEVFNQVKNHLLTQNRRAITDDGITCVYRTKPLFGKVLKCAAGCLISDDEYDPSMENRLWRILPGVPIEHRDLIMHLQTIHDTNSIELWKEKLQQAAKQYNLVF